MSASHGLAAAAAVASFVILASCAGSRWSVEAEGDVFGQEGRIKVQYEQLPEPYKREVRTQGCRVCDSLGAMRDTYRKVAADPSVPQSVRDAHKQLADNIEKGALDSCRKFRETVGECPTGP